MRSFSAVFFGVIAFVGAILSVRCSPGNTPGAHENDKITLPIEFSLNSEFARPATLEGLYKKYRAEKQVSFSAITESLLEAESHEYAGIGDGSVPKLVVEVVKGKTAKAIAKIQGNNPHDWKLAYESVLGNMTYNKEFNNLGHPFVKNKLQCFSGTLLNLYLMRSYFGARRYGSQNWVVIFTPGHALPGYLEKRGDTWSLFGIESTAKGRAKIIFGEVSKIAGPMRIVDAELFALLHPSRYYLADVIGTERAALAYTAKLYGKSEFGNVPLLGEGRNHHVGTKWHLFSFGSKDVPDGDIERAEFDETDEVATPGNRPRPITPVSGGVPSVVVPRGAPVIMPRVPDPEPHQGPRFYPGYDPSRAHPQYYPGYPSTPEEPRGSYNERSARPKARTNR